MGKYGAKKEEGSLRSLGVSQVPVDMPTKEKLRELAGDDTLSHTLRELVEKATKEKEASQVNQMAALLVYLPAAAFMDFTEFSQMYHQQAGNLEAMEISLIKGIKKGFQQARQMKLPEVELNGGSQGLPVGK